MNDEIFYTENRFAVETLFLRSLPKDLRGDHLFEYFSTFGSLQSVRIHIHAVDSFGFVRFQQAEDAAKVLKMKYHTIDGRKIVVEIARECHQDESTVNDDLPIESTNLTGTELMDLNDDCLGDVITRVTVMDLCSLLELSESIKSIRLKGIINEVFTRKHTTCDIVLRYVYTYVNGIVDVKISDMYVDTFDKCHRLLFNFGSLISDLSTNHFAKMQWILKYCGGTLKSLKMYSHTFETYEPKDAFHSLEKLHIADCYFKRDATNSFPLCKSLVELTVQHGSVCTPGSEAIYQQTFPELESYRGCCNSDHFKKFVSRHKKLKKIFLSDTVPPDLLSTIFEKCKELRTLHICTDGFANRAKYEMAAERTSSLTYLENLFIFDDEKQPICLMFVRQLRYLQSLKEVALVHSRLSSELLSALLHLKTLERLAFSNIASEYVINLNILAELCRLRKLQLSECDNIDFDVVFMVSRLPDLEEIVISESYPIYFSNDDKEMYSRIDDIRSRSGARQALEIYCERIKTVFPSHINAVHRKSVYAFDNY